MLRVPAHTHGGAASSRTRGRTSPGDGGGGAARRVTDSAVTLHRPQRLLTSRLGRAAQRCVQASGRASHTQRSALPPSFWRTGLPRREGRQPATLCCGQRQHRPAPREAGAAGTCSWRGGGGLPAMPGLRFPAAPALPRHTASAGPRRGHVVFIGETPPCRASGGVTVASLPPSRGGPCQRRGGGCLIFMRRGQRAGRGAGLTRALPACLMALATAGARG